MKCHKGFQGYTLSLSLPILSRPPLLPKVGLEALSQGAVRGAVLLGRHSVKSTAYGKTLYVLKSCLAIP